ncbi:hypothetical protein [Rhodopila sp.]|uniref:hypothetical protein n=1 Tax=Rhodopila sp. TaxID=2480087 RepID=UPI003D127A9E
MERLDATVGRLGDWAHGKRYEALDQEQVDAVVDVTVRGFDRIDILVNAVAGSTIIARSSATVEAHSLDD